jgi:hypothetical protein
MLNYLHIHLWLFVYAGLGAWFLLSVFNKDRLFIRNILFILFSSFILTIPFWTNYSKVALDPNYQFLEKIFGTDYTHRLIIPFGYPLLTMLALYLNKDLNSKKFFFLLSFLIGGLLCLNQQIITGKIIEPVHWTSYTNKTLLLIALIVGLRRIVPKSFSLVTRRVIFYFIISFLFFTGYIQQVNYYNANKKTFQGMQSLSGAITWLNANTKKDDVILTESIGHPRSGLLRIWMLYTRNYYYLAREAHSLISEEESQYRLLSAMHFFRYTKEEAYKIIEYMDGLHFVCMPARYGILKGKDVYLNKIKIKYDNLMSKDPSLLIKRYEVDYLLIEKESRFFESITNIYPYLSKVFDDGFVRIFKFK